jgi:hypothetical protein
VLELAGQEDSYEDFLNGPLDGNNRDDAQHCVRCVPELEEPLKCRG